MIDLSQLKILIIDDDPSQLQVMQKSLAQLGFKNIIQESEAEKAVAQYFTVTKEEPPFDLILCDQVMPVLSGIDVLKLIRLHYSKDSLPFIMVTSDGSRKNVVLMVSNKGNDFIIKPHKDDLLFEKIHKIFNSEES